MYIENFRNVHKTHKLRGGKDLAESVELLLCDLLHNVPHQQDHQKSDHEFFHVKDMIAFRDFAENALLRGGREHIYVSPYSLLPGGGVFVLARKRLKRVLVIRRCFWCSGRCYRVLSTKTIGKTHG